MSYLIDRDLCISCGICAAECPVDAIVQEKKSYRIDLSLCSGCGECAQVCPVGCISGG